MSLTYNLITKTRENLCDLSRSLMSGMEPEWLFDIDRPVIAWIRGSWRSGKKIIPDIAVEEVFDDTPDFVGKREFDEIYTGKHKDRTLQLAFINTAWGIGDSNYSTKNVSFKYMLKSLKASSMRDQMSHGGLLFVHNDGEKATLKPDLEIWIEDLVSTVWNAGNKRLDSVLPEYLSHQFYSAVTREENTDWWRFAQINVFNDEMAQSTQLVTALEALQQRYDLDKVKPCPAPL